MKRYAITHETKYAYGQPVELGLHIAGLSPLGNERQRLVEHSIDVTPSPAWVVAFADHFGNALHHISIETPHNELIVTQRATVEIVEPAWAEPPPGLPWESVRDAMRADSFPEYPQVSEFIYASPLAPHNDRATAYAQQSFLPGQTMVDGALDLARRFKADFTYSPGATTIATPVDEIMSERHGVCQDFAHAMISGLRGMGLPARYASGYLKTYAPQNGGQESVQLVGADASHAWVSVWCGPEVGWLDFDPTNALLVGYEHIAVAYGRDFSDVTPLRGVILGGGQHTLAVAVRVKPLS